MKETLWVTLLLQMELILLIGMKIQTHLFLTNWYVTAYSWFTDVNLRADNWLGFGPITIPDEGSTKFSFTQKRSQWRDDLIFM